MTEKEEKEQKNKREMYGKSPQKEIFFFFNGVLPRYRGCISSSSSKSAHIPPRQKNLFHRPFRKMKITPRKKRGGKEEENYKGEVRCSGIKRDGERKGGRAPLPAVTATHWVYAYRMYFSSSVHRSDRGKRRRMEEGPGWVGVRRSI